MLWLPVMGSLHQLEGDAVVCNDVCSQVPDSSDACARSPSPTALLQMLQAMRHLKGNRTTPCIWFLCLSCTSAVAAMWRRCTRSMTAGHPADVCDGRGGPHCAPVGRSDA